MLPYQLRLAWKSLRRNPFLSMLIIGGIALGIAVAMTFVTAYYVIAGNPIPHKSERLFYVQIDSWDPDRAWDDDDPTEPPDQLTYLDAMALMQSEIPTHHSAMHKAEFTVHPEEQGQRPYREVVRMCFADFFPLFDVPFRWGAGWDSSADTGPEPVVVLGHEINQKLFGGENSVGRALRIEDREFRVVGVLEPWRPIPKYYDPHNGDFEESEEIYMPFDFGRVFEAYSAGNNSNWKPYDGEDYQSWLSSENIWIQFWAQLDTAEQKEEYEAFLGAYALGQKELGRFQRPVNNKLRNVMQWLEFQHVVPDENRAMAIIALLFLLVCSVNLIGILLGKFLARSSEVGVRRALGASRRWVFVQHLMECELIGLLGGAIGLVLSVFGLRLLKRTYEIDLPYQLDGKMFLVALALALVSALIAGIYPAWRICAIQPGIHLKTQ